MAVYKQAEGLKYVMEQRWKKKRKNQFPTVKKDLVSRFTEIETFLNTNHHPYVNLGAACNGDGLLTDHGPEHVQMVMDKAYKLVGEDRAELLSGYEIFLLLIAIHFHDLGNIYGREDHERKILEVMEAVGERLSLDIVEQMCVKDIAMAHGGYADDAKADKDTIRLLPSTQPCNEIKIRPSLLAAVLRFADELSDDFTRSTNNVTIPPENEIFHAYSKCLEPIFFKGETISFHYRIPYEYTHKRLSKGNKKDILLYDEIIERLTKCMRELEYCRKYADGFIGITTLNVTIDIMKKNSPLSIADTDTFRLRLLGYPNEDQFKLESFIDASSIDGTTGKVQKTLKYSSGNALMRAMKGVK